MWRNGLSYMAGIQNGAAAVENWQRRKRLNIDYHMTQRFHSEGNEN